MPDKSSSYIFFIPFSRWLMMRSYMPGVNRYPERGENMNITWQLFDRIKRVGCLFSLFRTYQELFFHRMRMNSVKGWSLHHCYQNKRNWCLNLEKQKHYRLFVLLNIQNSGHKNITHAYSTSQRICYVFHAVFVVSECAPIGLICSLPLSMAMQLGCAMRHADCEPC